MSDDTNEKQAFSMTEAVAFIRAQQQAVSPGMRTILDHNRALRDARRAASASPATKKSE